MADPAPIPVLPSIDRLPYGEPPNVLAEFLDAHVRPWHASPARLSLVETGALWTLFALNIALGSWLLAVQTGSMVCTGSVCAVITLGNHPILPLVLGAACVGALLVAMPLTRGLTRSGGPPLVVVAVGGLCGVGAVAGVVAVVVAAALGLGVAVSILIFVIDRL